MILMLAAMFCTSCGNALDILGPRDKPDFRSKDWTSVSITYWVSTGTTNTLERSFAVTDKATVDGLREKMNVKEVTGLSIGTRSQLRFHESNGNSWHGSVVFENRINLSSTANKWRSYTIDLLDSALFDAMLDLCVRNERTFHPMVKRENIILRSNLRKNYPAVEE